MKQQQIAKLLCQAVGCVLALYILWMIFPYIVMFLALCGAWHLYQEYQRNNRNGGGRCR